MAEKVNIKSAVGKPYNGKTIVTVELSDGRKGSSYDEAVLDSIGKDIELDIKEGKEYQGVMQYYFNVPKVKGAFPKKDYTTDKRIGALNAASRLPGLKSDEVILLANKYLTWLNG
jgi:small nuclear ribonucleoprotein (snRNP)-like protein